MLTLTVFSWRRGECPKRTLLITLCQRLPTSSTAMRLRPWWEHLCRIFLDWFETGQRYWWGKCLHHNSGQPEESSYTLAWYCQSWWLFWGWWRRWGRGRSTGNVIEAEEGGRGGTFQSRRQGEEGYKQVWAKNIFKVHFFTIRMAVSQLHKSKAFKAKEALKAKKQRNAARWKKGKKEGKRKQHAKKFAKPKDWTEFYCRNIYIFSIRIRMKQKEIVEKRIIMLVDLKCFFSDIWKDGGFRLTAQVWHGDWYKSDRSAYFHNDR